MSGKPKPELKSGIEADDILEDEKGNPDHPPYDNYNWAYNPDWSVLQKLTSHDVKPLDQSSKLSNTHAAPNPASVVTEDFNGMKFLRLYDDFVDAYNVDGGRSAAWNRISANISSATATFQKKLLSREALKEWKGKTHDAAIANISQSITQIEIAAQGAAALSLLIDAFAGAVFQVRWYLDANIEGYMQSLLRWPHFEDQIDQAYDSFAQKVMTTVWTPNIQAIADKNPSFMPVEQASTNGPDTDAPPPDGPPPIVLGGPPPPDSVTGPNGSSLNLPDIGGPPPTAGPNVDGGPFNGDANLNPFTNPSDISGDPLVPNGNPLDQAADLLDPNGNQLDLNGNPLGPNGNQLDLNGNPLGPNGNQLDLNGNPLGPNGNLPGQAANLLDPNGMRLGPNGNPLDSNGNAFNGAVNPLGGGANPLNAAAGPGSGSSFGNTLGPATSALGQAGQTLQPLEQALGAAQKRQAGTPGGLASLSPKGLDAVNKPRAALGHAGGGAGGGMPSVGHGSLSPVGAPVAGVSKDSVDSRSPLSNASAPLGAAGASGGSPGSGGGAGQRGPSGKDHKQNKALRRKKNGEWVIGDVEAVVPVIGDDEPEEAAPVQQVPLPSAPRVSPALTMPISRPGASRPRTEQVP